MIFDKIFDELMTPTGLGVAVAYWLAKERGADQVSNAVFGLEGDVMALHSKATALTVGQTARARFRQLGGKWRLIAAISIA